MQLLRKILFYIFTIAYIIICPLLILYAFGYIYKPGTENGYVKTGLIYLSTAPPGADVYMNSSKNKQKTPVVLRDLTSGSYDIRIELDGYEAWQQKVPVEAEKATVLDKILLTPDEWKSTLLAEGRFENIVPIPGTDYFLALKSGKKLDEVLVCDHAAGKTRLAVKNTSKFANTTIQRIYVEDESGFIVVSAQDEGKKRYIRLKLADNGDKVKDITALMPEEMDRITWEAGSEDALYVLEGTSLTKIDAGAGAVYPEIVKNVKGLGLFGGNIYVVDGNNKVFIAGGDGKEKTILLEDPRTGASIFGRNVTYDIKVISPEKILFAGSDGSLVSNKLPYRFVDKGLVEVNPTDSGDRAMVVTEKKIGILDFTTEKTGSSGFEMGPQLTWIYDKGREIEQGEWVYKDSHVLFRDGSSVSLIEIEVYGEFVLSKVFDVKKNTDISYSDPRGSMHFLDKNDSMLRGLEIVPIKGVIEVPFPKLEKERKKNRIQEITTQQ